MFYCTLLDKKNQAKLLHNLGEQIERSTYGSRNGYV